MWVEGTKHLAGKVQLLIWSGCRGHKGVLFLPYLCRLYTTVIPLTLFGKVLQHKRETYAVCVVTLNVFFRAVVRHLGAWGRVGPLLPRWEASGTSSGPEPRGGSLGLLFRHGLSQPWGELGGCGVEGTGSLSVKEQGREVRQDMHFPLQAWQLFLLELMPALHPKDGEPAPWQSSSSAGLSPGLTGMQSYYLRPFFLAIHLACFVTSFFTIIFPQNEVGKND